MGHNSAQRAFQKLSFGDSESSLRALRDGANGAFGALFGYFFGRKMSLGVGGVGQAPLAQTASYKNNISSSLRSPKSTLIFTVSRPNGVPKIARGPIFYVNRMRGLRLCQVRRGRVVATAEPPLLLDELR